MRYQVEFLVKAIIGVSIAGNGFEDAIEEAKKAVSKNGLINSDYENIDIQWTPVGVTSQDGWDVMNEDFPK